MKREIALETLKKIKPELVEKFGVKRLAIFGSTARNEATEKSDIDILVSFEEIATSARYFGLQFYLEDKLGCAIDLVTDKAIRAELRPYIEHEAIHV